MDPRILLVDKGADVHSLPTNDNNTDNGEHGDTTNGICVYTKEQGIDPLTTREYLTKHRVFSGRVPSSVSIMVPTLLTYLSGFLSLAHLLSEPEPRPFSRDPSSQLEQRYPQPGLSQPASLRNPCNRFN